MVLVAVVAHGLVLPRHTLSPQAAAPPTLARRGAPLYAQVDEELQETVEKSGVEGGLFSIFTGDGDAKEKATTAGDLLKQYGGAYLLTSTSFAIVSFAICYTLVSNGVDVAGLLGGAEDHFDSSEGTFAEPPEVLEKADAVAQLAKLKVEQVDMTQKIDFLWTEEQILLREKAKLAVWQKELDVWQVCCVSAPCNGRARACAVRGFASAKTEFLCVVLFVRVLFLFVLLVVVGSAACWCFSPVLARVCVFGFRVSLFVS